MAKRFTYHKGGKTPWTLTKSEKHKTLKEFERLSWATQRWYRLSGYIRAIAESKFLEYGITHKWHLPPAKKETIEQVKEWLIGINKPKTEYFGQYGGAGTRFITRIKLTTGEIISTMIPINGDYGFIDGRWVDKLRSLRHGSLPLDMLAAIESLHYEGIRYRFMNPNDGWDYEHPIQVDGDVSIRDFFIRN